MFVAMRQNGELLNVLEYERQDLLLLQKKERFVCPACKEEVRLRMGTIRRYHFAHKKEMCAAHAEHESVYHMQGKEHLYEWFRAQGYTVEMESYIPSIMQRADLYVTSGGAKLAVEYQCSPIAASQFMKRTMSYWKDGYRVLWILGGHHFKRYTSCSVRMSPFHSLFIQYSPSPYILYYCPSIRLFAKCSSLIPFSSASSFARITMLPFASTTAASLFAPSYVSLSLLKDQWLRRKKKWRMEKHLYMRYTNQELLQLLYEARIPASCLPAEAGNPVPSILAFRTPAIVWQTYILLGVIHRMKEGERVSLRVICTFVRDHPNIRQRLLPYYPSAFWRGAVHEYMQLLVLSGLMAETEPDMYKKIKPVAVPKTEADAHECDKKIINYAVTLFSYRQTVTCEEEKRI